MGEVEWALIGLNALYGLVVLIIAWRGGKAEEIAIPIVFWFFLLLPTAAVLSGGEK